MKVGVKVLLAWLLLCILGGGQKWVGLPLSFAQDGSDSHPSRSPHPDEISLVEYQLVSPEGGEKPIFRQYGMGFGTSQIPVIAAEVQEFVDHHGTLPQFVVVSSDPKDSKLQAWVQDLETSIRQKHPGFSTTQFMNLDELGRSEAPHLYPIHQQLLREVRIPHPTQYGVNGGDAEEQRLERRRARTHGFFMAVLGGAIWYVNYHDLVRATAMAAAVMAERLLYLQYRVQFDNFKRWPDQWLARMTNSKLKMMVASVSWKYFVDIFFFGLILVQLPRAIDWWGFQAYSGDLAFGADPKVGWLAVLGGLIWQSTLHSLADPISLGRVFSEGMGVISHRTSQMITYIKPYANSLITLMRTVENQKLRDFGYTLTYTLIGGGFLSCLISWPNMFHLFGGGMVVIGPDLRKHYVRRSESFGARFVLEEASSPEGLRPKSFWVDTFIGYQPVFEHREQILKFDDKTFVFKLREVSVRRMEGETSFDITDEAIKRTVLSRLVVAEKGGAQAYRIEGDKILLDLNGKSYIIDRFPLYQSPGSASHGLADTEVLPLKGPDDLLLKALWSNGELRVKRLDTLEGGSDLMVLDTVGFKVYNRFGFHVRRDSNGHWSRMSEAARQYVDYMIGLNKKRGRILRVELSDQVWVYDKQSGRRVFKNSTFLRRLRQHVSYMRARIQGWFWHTSAPQHACGPLVRQW
jgi:hypothetical protein